MVGRRSPPPRPAVAGAPPECACPACDALRAEAGSNFPWLRLKLLTKGWAGKRSEAERAYQLAHTGWAKQGAASGNLTAQGRIGAGMPRQGPKRPNGEGSAVSGRL